MPEEISRRNFIKTIGLGAAALSVPYNFSFPAILKNKKPNILFIMTDDHAYHAISAYGSKINKTPQIDRIAGEGMRLDNCFCTNSICAPSRAAILTGKYNHVNGVIDNKVVFDSSQMTFPKLFQSAGYETSLVGKWHLKSDPTGFDYWNIVPGQGSYYNPDFIEMGERKRIEGYSTDITTDITLNWLKNRNKSKPFCMLLQHKAPHRNFMPDLKYLNKYDDVDIPLPETFFDDYATRSAAAKEQEMEIVNPKHMGWGFDLKLDPQYEIDERLKEYWIGTLERFTPEQRKAWDAAYDPKNEAFLKANLEGKELDKWRYQRFIKDYLRCVDSVDDSVGRVLDYLDEQGLAEDTVVVYTSDQGFFIGDHGWFDKRFMYEETLRMPYLIRYPELISPGKSNDDFIMNIDFAPTFLELAGLKVPEEMQGNSFKTILEGNEPAKWRDAIYYHYYEYPGWHMVKKHYGIRTERYKLIHFYDDIDAWELYDLKEDPHELNNIYSKPGFAETVSGLKKRLHELQVQYGDTDFLK